MDKRSFTIIIVILAVTFSVITAIKLYHPKSDSEVSFADFPTNLDGWVGIKNNIPDYFYELLNPQDIFSATYENEEGVRIQLFFDFFSPDQGFGGPHSPRNCMPGAGWIILENNQNKLKLPTREIDCHRLKLLYDGTNHIMDFWYVTHHGETGNDYIFKIYQIFSSLTFKPKDIAFIRFITEDKPGNEKALKEFQQLFVEEIYKRLPFENNR